MHEIKSDDTEVGLKSNLDIVDAGTGDADLSRSDAMCPDVGGHNDLWQDATKYWDYDIRVSNTRMPSVTVTQIAEEVGQ